MSEKLRIYHNPFSSWVDFGTGIPPENIEITMTDTTPESQDHPDLVSVKDNLIRTSQEKVNQKAKERGVEPRQLFDGQLPRLDGMTVQDGHAQINVGKTSYFRHVAYSTEMVEPRSASIMSPNLQSLDDDGWTEKTPDYHPTPIGGGLAIVIEDGKYIMIGTPLEQTDEQFLLKAAPSGYGHSRADLNADGVYRPETTVLREMEEETGIKPDEVRNLKLRGRPFEKLLGKPCVSLVFTAEAPQLTRQEIIKREKEEKDKMLFIPYTKQALRQAVLSYPMTSQGYMQGMLISLARDKFGEDEVRYLNDRLKKRGEFYFAYLTKHQREQIKKKQEARLSPERIRNTVFRSDEGSA